MDQLNKFSPEDQAAIIQKAKDMIARKLRASDSASMAGRGLALGAGVAGVTTLAKLFGEAIDRPSDSYTTPVEAVVYRPDREAKRRRSRKRAQFGGPETPVDALRGEDIWRYAAPTAAMAVGAPLGFMAAKKLTEHIKRIARHRELADAQRDFESSLQEYAEAGDEPKRVIKRAMMSEREQLIDRLAENCHKLSKTALFEDVVPGYLAWATLAPMVGGLYGFKNRWGSRASKDLNTAERQLNSQREKLNPTFSVATLKDPPDRDKPPEDEDEHKEQIRRSIEEAIAQVDTDYL